MGNADNAHEPAALHVNSHLRHPGSAQRSSALCNSDVRDALLATEAVDLLEKQPERSQEFKPANVKSGDAVINFESA